MGLPSNMDCYICDDEEIVGKSTILIRAFAIGGPNAKCKVHLAFRPKMCSAAGRLKVGKCKFFRRVRWHCRTMQKIILIFYSTFFLSHLSLSLCHSLSLTLSSLSPSSLSHFGSVSDARSKTQTSRISVCHRR